MDLSDGENLFKKIAAGLGLLQGLAWSILSLISMILYNENDRKVKVRSYIDTISFDIYNLFFLRNTSNGFIFDEQILNPLIFYSFASIHFVFNIVWLGVSIYVLLHQGPKLIQGMRIWSYQTFTVSLWDLIHVIILGVDYGRCLRHVDEFHSDNAIYFEKICANGILPVLVIAARGFALWIVNVVFAKILMDIRKRVEKNARDIIVPEHRPRPPAYSPREAIQNTAT